MALAHLDANATFLCKTGDLATGSKNTEKKRALVSQSPKRTKELPESQGQMY